jgi:hypothetical protein
LVLLSHQKDSFSFYKEKNMCSQVGETASIFFKYLLIMVGLTTMLWNLF